MNANSIENKFHNVVDLTKLNLNIHMRQSIQESTK